MAANNSKQVYDTDLTDAAWARGLDALPAWPETVAFYISQFAETHKPATIGRHLAAIASAHKARGYTWPASMQHGGVSAVWPGIRRTHATAQTQKAPLMDALELWRDAGAAGNARRGVVG